MASDYAVVPITVAEGGGLRETWELQDGDGAAIVITGDTFTAHVRAAYDTTLTELLDISPSVTNGAAGEITFSVLESDADLIALAVGEYVYDLFRKPVGIPRLKIAEGPFVKTAAATDF